MERGNILDRLESTAKAFFPMLKYYGYALTLTTPMEDLCELYFDQLSDPEVRTQVRNLIKKKIEHREDPIPPFYLEGLLNEFSASTGPIRKSVSESIITVQKYFPKEQLTEFFNEQVRSDIAADRKTAIAIAPSIYDGEVDKKLWQCWFDFEDKACAEVLFDNSPPEQLSLNFRSVWQSENLSRHTKLKFLKKVAKYNFERVRFLEQENPTSYLTACIAAGEDVSDEFCLETLRSVDKLDTLDYAIWCMGMLEKREFLLGIPNYLNQILDELLISKA